MELYKHNKETYDKVIQELKRTNRVGIIQATGTGKSFITMKLFQDYFKNVHKMYIVPNTSIGESIQLYDEWSNDKVVFTTYQFLSRMDEETLLIYTKAFDVFLLDEFHHAGAPTWSIPVNILKEHAKYVIGTSATPIRYMDNARNMAVELFGKGIVYGPSREYAIQTGILPKFKYVAILSDVVKKIEKAAQKLEDYVKFNGENKETYTIKEKIIKLQLDDQSAYEVGVILRKHKEPGHLKWLVFCTDMEELETIDIELRDWFDTDNIKILAVHSKMSKQQIKNTLSEFKNYTGLVILKSINVLNEGVHVEGVNALIMLRRTESRNIFDQEIGRGLSSGYKGVTPLVIDVAGNYENIKEVGSSYKQMLGISTNEDTVNAPYQTVENLVVIDDIILSIEDLFESISNLPVSAVWEDWEDRILDDNYQYMGPKVARLIPNKTEKDCSIRAKQRGLSFRKRYTPDEDLIIKQFFPKEGRKVALRLKGRTEESVIARASTLKVKYIGNWTISEEVTLITYYRKEGEKCFSRIPTKTVEECKAHVIKLRLY